MGVVAYRAPMAATRLSIASGTCPAPALPALRLTSAMVERGARVVGTPLLVWMACLITNASDLWTAPSISKLKTCAFDRQIEQKSDRRNKTWTVKDSAVLLFAGREDHRETALRLPTRSQPRHATIASLNIFYQPNTMVTSNHNLHITSHRKRCIIFNCKGNCLFVTIGVIFRCTTPSKRPVPLLVWPICISAAATLLPSSYHIFA
jgi:hypothetical protein